MIFGNPPDDVKTYLGMTKDQGFRIRKAIYGLLNAPRQWLSKLAKELKNQGWKQCVLEPCIWRLFSEGKLVGLLGVHVDDVIVSGSGPVYEAKITELRNTFPFGSWKSAQKEKTVFCGCELSQKNNGEINLKQERYALGLNEVNIERKQELESQAT